jgi:predicted PurR-regulated permease PerM
MLTDAQKWLWLAVAVLCGWVLYLLAPVLTPFLVAALLAYLGDPLVDRLQKLRLSRTVAVMLVFAAMLLAGLGALFVLVPLLQQQVLRLVDWLPQLLDWLQTVLLPRINAALGVQLEAVDMEAIRNALRENWRDIGSVVGLVLGRVGSSGQALAAWFAFVLLVPVVTFYLLRDWDGLVQAVRALLPRQLEPTIAGLARECDRVLAEFLRGQLLVMLALGLIYSIGLWIAGVEFALLIGMLAGLVSFVPYLGSIVGVLLAGAVAFVQYQDVLHLIYVGVVFGAGQAVEGMVLSPWLVGERIGLHPVAVIFAVLAGGQLFGFFGILIALPAAAMITVLLRYARGRYLQSGLYGP